MKGSNMANVLSVKGFSMVLNFPMTHLISEYRYNYLIHNVLQVSNPRFNEEEY